MESEFRSLASRAASVALAAFASCDAAAAQWIDGPMLRKVVVNEKPLTGRATWSVSGLGVFTCAISGQLVVVLERTGAEEWNLEIERK